ncbi:MAG: HD domain-containing protein [Alphaproteobacteria bacterium]
MPENVITLKNDWPDSFDFRTDKTCQEVFKPFIEDQLKKLAAYDAQRPANITYIFHEHAIRVGDMLKKTCLHMGLGQTVAENMNWSGQPHDIGKMEQSTSVWDKKERVDETHPVYALRRIHPDLGVQIVETELAGISHPFKDLMLDIMKYHHERMDGTGPHKIPGERLSAPVRLAAIVEAYDGSTIPRGHEKETGRDISPPGALTRMRAKGPAVFDMDLFEPFAEMILSTYNEP